MNEESDLEPDAEQPDGGGDRPRELKDSKLDQIAEDIRADVSSGETGAEPSDPEAAADLELEERQTVEPGAVYPWVAMLWHWSWLNLATMYGEETRERVEEALDEGQSQRIAEATARALDYYLPEGWARGVGSPGMQLAGTVGKEAAFGPGGVLLQEAMQQDEEEEPAEGDAPTADQVDGGEESSGEDQEDEEDEGSGADAPAPLGPTEA